MPRKSEKPTADKTPKNVYFFPSIGDGISVEAESYEEALVTAEQIKVNLSASPSQ